MATSEHIGFHRSVVTDQLPQSSVYRTAQDQVGFLWFATREGVARWDGYEMLVYKYRPFDSQSLWNNISHGLYVDNADRVWIWGEAGYDASNNVAYVSSDRQSVQRVDAAESIVVGNLIGEALVISPGLISRFDHETLQLVPLHHRSAEVPLAATVGRDGVVWVGSVAGQLEQCTASGCAVVDIDGGWPGTAAISVLEVDSDGNLWVGTWDSGLRILTTAEGQPVSAPEIAIHRVSDIAQTREGDVWITGEAGVYRVGRSADSMTWEISPFQIERSNGQPNREIKDVFEDRSGSLWLGSVWGLYRYDPARPIFHHLGSAAGIDEHELTWVMSIAESADGNLWAGSYGDGATRLNSGGELQPLNLSPLVSNDSVTIWSILATPEPVSASRPLWLGTDRHGLLAFDSQTGAIRQFAINPLGQQLPQTNLTGSDISALAWGKNDSLWVGTSTGLRRFDIRTGTFSESILPRSAPVFDIEPGENSLWVATLGEGAFELSIDGQIITRLIHDPKDPGSLSSNRLQDIYPGTDGQIWIAGHGGLDRFSPGQGVNLHLDDRDGLLSSLLICVAQSPQGDVWASSNTGLSRIVFDQTGAVSGVQTYGMQDGLVNSEFNRGAVLAARDGDLYFGGDRGVTRIDTQRDLSKSVPPEVAITRLQRYTPATVLDTPITGDVTFDPDVHAFAITLAALSYGSSDANRYSVKLDGYDTDWIELGSRRVTSYTNLPPGEYEFLARASGPVGGWGETSKPMRIQVLPSFWETTVFRIVVLVVAILLTAWLVWLPLNARYRRRLAKVALNEAIAEERDRISRDMHDELGAALTEISVLSELGQHEHHRDHAFGRIADRARAALAAASEIVWTASPGNDHLAALIAYLREYAFDLAESTQLVMHFEATQNLGERAVSAQLRRNILLAFKESLTNVVRHAHADTVWVDVNVTTNGLEIAIRDNGVGADNPGTGESTSARHGHGCANMSKRMTQIGGDACISANPDGPGTEVRLTVPLK